MEPDPIELTEAWLAFVEMRKAKGKRAPFTERAKKRILFELRRFQADNQDVDSILWASVTNGWSGVFPARRNGWQAPSPSLTVPSPEAAKTARLLADAEAHRAEVERQRLARKTA